MVMTYSQSKVQGQQSVGSKDKAYGRTNRQTEVITLPSSITCMMTVTDASADATKYVARAGVDDFVARCDFVACYNVARCHNVTSTGVDVTLLLIPMYVKVRLASRPTFWLRPRALGHHLTSLLITAKFLFNIPDSKGQLLRVKEGCIYSEPQKTILRRRACRRKCGFVMLNVPVTLMAMQLTATHDESTSCLLGDPVITVLRPQIV